MKVTLKDIKTGAIASHPHEDFDLWWWSNGNGSCDCNRAYAFGQSVVEELEAEYGRNTCYGAHRFIAIDFSMNIDSAEREASIAYTTEEILKEINNEYEETI